MAEVINDFLSGAKDNWDFDDKIYSLKTRDEMCINIRDQMWFFYDDVKRYFNRDKFALNPAVADLFRRWEYLLRSNVDWTEIVQPLPLSPWRVLWDRFIVSRLQPKAKTKYNKYWPFANSEAWNLFVQRNAKL